MALSPTDRAIRIACQAIVVLWIAAFLGWRELAPRELRVAVKATTIEAHELPPAPAEPESIAEPEAETEATTEPEPEPERKAEAEPEPEEIRDVEPEAQVAEAEPPLVDAMPEPSPRVEPVPEPEAPPLVPEPSEWAALDVASLPEPSAAPAPLAQAPAPAAASIQAPPLPLVAVDETDVARGGTLLAGETGFPTLESRYEGYGSFAEYARAMQRLGARFVVVSRREIVGTIDPWTLETGALGDPAGLSPRARDFAGEPELVRAGRAVRRDHGVRAQVMMLVPHRIDAGLFGGISRAIEARGDEAASYRQIRAHYERGPGGTLRLRVETAVRRDGREDPLPLLFDLDRLARGSRV